MTQKFFEGMQLAAQYLGHKDAYQALSTSKDISNFINFKTWY